MRGTLEVALKANLHPRHQHCTDEAQNPKQYCLQLVIYIYRWLLKLHLHLSISTALMRPRRPKQYCLQLDIALWCKNQIEHSIWDESLLFSNCTRSLEYSSSSTLAGLSYHICGKLEVAFKASPSSQHQHCTDEAQKAETVSALVTFSFVICRFARMPSFQYPCSLVAQFSEEVYKNAGASDVLPLVMGSLDVDKV